MAPSLFVPLMQSTPVMFHSMKKTKPTGFSKTSERELMKKNYISCSSGGVPRSGSQNFNCRHHQHLGTRKSQRANNKRRRTRRNCELIFMTQNVQGLNILTYHIRNQSRKSQASITFQSECRLETNQQLQVKNHEIFIHGESSHTCGVSIVLNKHATHAWKLASSQPPIATKGRIMGLHLEFGHEKKRTKCFAIATYLPCTGSKHHDFETIVDDLTLLIKKECKNGIKPIIGGDFTNRNHYGENVSQCHGPHGIAADINDRGRTITDFLQQLKLCNPASFFKKSNYATWISQNVKLQTTNKFLTLDYILMPYLDFKFLH